MSTKKKILLLTDWYEPGYKAGGPVRSCVNFVSAMGDGYRFFVLTSDRDLGDTSSYPSVEPDTWMAKAPDVQVWYASPGRLTASVVRRLVQEIGPDHVYLNSMYSWNFTILPLLLRWRYGLPGKWVLAPRGMLHQGAMQFKPAKKKLFLGLIKRTGVARRLTFQATDRQEQSDILQYFPGADVVVLPNFSSSEPVAWRPVVKVAGALRCIFISRVAPKKNLLFLLDILRDWSEDSVLELTIRGDVEDREYWEKCLATIRALPGSVTVRFDGPVPNEQVIPVLQEHHLFVLPTFGENFGHAIFEALLAGKPVLISDKTPWLGLEEKKLGHDLPLESAGFERALRFYASMDQSAYDEWSKAAWVYAKDIQEASQLKQDYKRMFS